jgi:hypothetical protein
VELVKKNKKDKKGRGEIFGFFALALDGGRS